MGNNQPELRTIDPTRTILSMDDHAARALNRFTGANPADIETAKFKEGEAMRALVKTKLNAVTNTSPAVDAPATTTTSKGPLILSSQSPHTPEHRQYLEKTIQTALPSLRKAFSNARIEIPTDTEILQAMTMTNRFTPEQIEALMRNIQVPGLIVLPAQMQSFEDYVRLLNANKKRQRQYDVSASDNRTTAFSKQDKTLRDERKGQPAECKFGIGEMTQEPQNRQGKLRDIVEKWEGSPLANLTRTATPRQYAVLQAQAKDLLDLNGWTILSEENAPHKIIGDDNLASGANGYYFWAGGNGVRFNEYSPELDCSYARVRPVVVG
ncbi:hypothetical protein M0P48_00245 [Candidatus Gracilibacteria bacterium]|nr:hypothetical protein [Candidatus Gracilibacteria bacterium]